MSMSIETASVETVNIAESLSQHNEKAIKSYQKSSKYPSVEHIPGDSGLPGIGHLYPFLKHLHRWLNVQYEQYGPVFKLNTPVIKGVYLIGAEANKLVLQNEDKIFSNHLVWEPIHESLFDNSILQRDFKIHKSQRKILQNAFKRPLMEAHIGIMNPLMSEGVNQLPSNKPIKSMGFVKQLLLNMSSEVFLGLEIGEKANKLNQAFTDIVNATYDPIRRKELWFSPYAKGVKGNKIIGEFIYDNIEQRRRGVGKDMFTHLCGLRDDDGCLLTDEQVKDHLLFLLFAAHDTTTSALSAILYALASDLEWQQVLRDEIHALNKDAIEFNDLEALDKIGWTFNEALRMYPALHSIPRYVLKDFEFNGHVIPADSNVLISPLMTHYMPEYWDNPTQFDPLRFSPHRAEYKNDFYQYIPFGGGAHKCLGLHFAQVQAKMFLFYLLKNFKVTKHPKMTSYKYNNVPLTFPTDGLPLTFSKI